MTLSTVLAAAQLLLAAPAEPSTLQTLKTHCMLHAADPLNPWALAHGITALGPTYAAADGRRATEVIVRDFLRQGQDPLAMPYSFDRYAADGTPVEPHTNLLVKTLALAKVPPKTAFATSFDKKVTLQELIDGVKSGFRHARTSDGYWLDVAWTLDLLAATLKPGRGAVFKNAAGEEIDFNLVMDDALAYLERAQSDLAAGLDKGLPQVDKRKQGIYAHHCGGLHLVQAVGSWARHKEVRQKWDARWTRQIDILFYRLGSEARQYEQAIEQAPQYRLALLVQMLKFYGHFLETTGRFKTEAGFRPTAAQQATIAKAKALLDWTARELSASGAFESMAKLKASQKQIYLDLIGDSCHAAHGLDYWR